MALKLCPSVGSVAESLDRLENLAKQRGMKVFARIDFSADAAAVGMKLRTMQLLILGNPKGGTPLMQAVASTALDLPLKVLAWQDDGRGLPTFIQSARISIAATWLSRGAGGEHRRAAHAGRNRVQGVMERVKHVLTINGGSSSLRYALFEVSQPGRAARRHPKRLLEGKI